MSARTKARKRAVDVLYGADLRERPLADALVEEQRRADGEPARQASWSYAREIVEGVDAHLDELDVAISAHAHGWTLDRMPVLDRAIIRAAAWEILFNDEVPDGVAISEAVQLAGELSTDDSGGFVNGVLSAIARDR
ncbi:transcription antitermination factor NusB [Protaetiibacter mangrovi]|uniref:Transcription antitermination protein NusB n=1 Tax=Protaetiibacter mangrovi TaxID=2970926 RepID=A0ABT1ZBW0_9MICO|nr:transcription antitermination factor NusB [Protaetiibacter mangrovi]MCS0498191.1 transcription antitermination factor NusB [Protaetiibacter mangrovi]TPX00499.1 transcription antitermination factor NusB [Schumannella luteola]